MYIRGYRTETRQTPFSLGFLLVYIDQNKPRDIALDEAYQKTEAQLIENSGSNIVGQRVRALRDEILISTKERELIGNDYFRNKIDGTNGQIKYSLERMMKLYNDIKKITIFGFPYFHHTDFPEADLNASIEMKKNYIRKAKGRDNRIGHNFEAIAEWFVDKLTIGAKFRTQNHRDQTMDSKRITLSLIKSVGNRKRNAEVDRIWTVKPSPLAGEITYVLQSKYGLITRKDLDDHLEVLKWSREYGVDTPNGRAMKQGVTPIFTGGSYNPKNTVRIRNEEINLPEYARRMNVELIKSADLNEKLREKGVDKYVTVQKICRASKNEKQVRETLTKIWNQPKKGREFLTQLTNDNQDLFEFERALEVKEDPSIDR